MASSFWSQLTVANVSDVDQYAGSRRVLFLAIWLVPGGQLSHPALVGNRRYDTWDGNGNGGWAKDQAGHGARLAARQTGSPQYGVPGSAPRRTVARRLALTGISGSMPITVSRMMRRGTRGLRTRIWVAHCSGGARANRRPKVVRSKEQYLQILGSRST